MYVPAILQNVTLYLIVLIRVPSSVRGGQSFIDFKTQDMIFVVNLKDETSR